MSEVDILLLLIFIPLATLLGFALVPLVWWLRHPTTLTKEFWEI